MEQYIPRITPVMLRDQPDQTCDTLNRLVAKINTMQTQITALNNEIVELKHMQDLDIEWLDDLEYRVKVLEHTYPGGDYQQILLFDSTLMGTAPGMCLQNCREGFGITTGHFPTARADWESQITNGTLHSGTPPLYLQVPVYIDTGVAAGHVVVWDRGTVWSDGQIIPQGLSYYSNVIGWGELCDNTRVVQRI